MSSVHERDDCSDSKHEPPRQRQKISPDVGPPKSGRSSRNAWTLIDADLIPGVTKIGNRGKYQFVIPLSIIPGLNRIALGVRNTATDLLFRIRLSSTATKFYFHFLPNDHEDSECHNYCSTAVPWDDHSSRYWCSSDPNFMTHMMTKIWHRVLIETGHRLREKSATDIWSALITVAMDVNTKATTHCIISSESCQPSLGFTAARPVACSAKCLEEFQKWPLHVRLSPLLREPSVIDLLLTCLSAQVTALLLEPHLNPSGYPTPPLDILDAGKLLRILDTFPPMTPGITLKEIINFGKMGKERCQVLNWLCARFQGMIVPAPESDQVMFHKPGYDSTDKSRRDDLELLPKTFLLLNTNPQRQVKFEAQLAEKSQTNGGSAAFHGTPAQNTFNILCEGIKQNINSDGHVWYSGSPFSSTYHMWKNMPQGHQLLYRSWSNSMFKNQQLLFGLEVTGPTGFDSFSTGISPQDKLMIRHLFFIPADAEESCRNVRGSDQPWADQSIRPKMEGTFSRIHDGTLIRDVQGETTG
ncbi:hypothetical protein PG993_011471 [Apiospora rasikravindrae]|uniref:Uncharacterized protein n=1 Tax=Apiospora rasikravindrae TaxID=990691 RepID=A0ABR1SFN0_9PEZI